MAWLDEISAAAYTSPGGKRMEFNYDSSVERTTALKTAESTFPDVDGAQVQSLGLGGKKFPMTAIFSGADCFKDADAFEELLCERGFGQLEHPIYGKQNVVPTGEISRTDDLVGALNESRVKVTFAETLVDRTFPEGAVSASDALSAAMDGYEAAAVEQFAQIIETGSIDDEIGLQAALKTQSASLFKGVAAMLSKAGANAAQKLNGFKRSVDGWIGKVDALAANAQNIATVLIKTARLPAKIAVDAMAKIEGYSSTIKDIINNVKKDPLGFAAVRNQYAATSAMMGALVASMASGVAETAMEAGGSGQGAQSSGGGGADNPASSGGTASGSSAGGFRSRADVLAAADAVAAQFELYKEYMDSQTAKDAFVDTGETYAALLDTVVASVQVMQQAAFDFPMARTVRLGRDRQVIELLCELYGADGFARLDQFITDNALTADEIVLLPMGREVTYYG